MKNLAAGCKECSAVRQNPPGVPSLSRFNRKTNELELATSFGLSDEYINKEPVSALRSIAQSLEDGPVAIYDVMDDPRIQYPKAALKS